MNQTMNLENAYLAGGPTQHARRLHNKALLSSRLNRLVGKRLGRDVYLDSPEGTGSSESNPAHSARGLQTVPINRIVGSISRIQDFDRTFRPLTSHTVGRWVNIDNAFHEGVSLPPVELYSKDGKYFVVDGHHRISVALLHGQEFIDAIVMPMP